MEEFANYGTKVEKEMQITGEAAFHLSSISKWSKFISIISIVSLALTLLLLLSLGALYSTMSEYLEGIVPYSLNMFNRIYILAYIVVIIAYFIPYYFLYQFSSRLKRALAANDSQQITEAFSYLRKHFITIGIFIIIGLFLFFTILLTTIAAIIAIV